VAPSSGEGEGFDELTALLDDCGRLLSAGENADARRGCVLLSEFAAKFQQPRGAKFVKLSVAAIT